MHHMNTIFILLQRKQQLPLLKMKKTLSSCTCWSTSLPHLVPSFWLPFSFSLFPSLSWECERPLLTISLFSLRRRRLLWWSRQDTWTPLTSSLTMLKMYDLCCMQHSAHRSLVVTVLTHIIILYYRVHYCYWCMSHIIKKKFTYYMTGWWYITFKRSCYTIRMMLSAWGRHLTPTCNRDRLYIDLYKLRQLWGEE